MNETPSGRYQGNPFSPVAVAEVSDSGTDGLTIVTTAIQRAYRTVDGFLSAKNVTNSGNVLAVTGSYGSGKTHLAMQLLQRAQRTTIHSVHTMYLDAASDSFTQLYYRFIRELGIDGVKALVNDFYAGAVADSLQTGFSEQSVAAIRSGSVRPTDVVDRLSMMESELQRRVTTQLISATHQVSSGSDLGQALGLLLRPGFEEVVWDWLTGGAPSSVLLERGIVGQIDDDVTALDAMAILAVMRGRQNHRFVLVLDELDKILHPEYRSPVETMAALQRLMQVCQGSGTLLVLSGLPDFLAAMRQDAHQRIAETIHVSGLSPTEVQEFTNRAQQRSDLPRVRFGPAACVRLTELTEGVPRQVIRMCHQLYRTALEGDRAVDPEMVDDEAREQSAALGHTGLVNAVCGQLDALGIVYRRDVRLKESQGTTVDILINNSADTPVAMELTGPLLGNDVDGVLRQLRKIDANFNRVHLLLITDGMVAPEIASRVNQVLAADVLRYDHRSFREDLRSLLTLLTSADETDPAKTHDLLARMSRQQASLVDAIDQMRAENDRREAETQKALKAIRRGINSSHNLIAHDSVINIVETTSRVPSAVATLFESALAAVEQMTDLDARMALAFEESSDVIKLDLVSVDMRDNVGTAATLRYLINAFAEAITVWDSRFNSGPDAPKRRRSELTKVCRTFDRLYESLPIRRSEIHSTVEQLGERVYNAMMSSS